MIQRYSSLRTKLTQSFLTEALKGAYNYDRIAGYFSSSLLEVAGEILESVSGKIRIVCNSDLNLQDVVTAKAAALAMRREWCASEPEKSTAPRNRFQRLYHFIRSGKIEVRVLPREKFGLLHGKAGVITRADGQKISFLGSTNETREGWEMNYELIWVDDSTEAVAWVEEEFNALWNHIHAVPLAEFVIQDIGRIAERSEILDIEEWKKQKDLDPAAPIIESPVYRKEAGLWEHQKYFVKLAFDAHRGPYGARLVLADQVGLGKTLQLAMSAELMAMVGNDPILIIAPKTLLFQWQDEMKNLLDLPSAVWNGKQWIDENGIEYPNNTLEGITRCPRRIGIISQGLITSRSEVVEPLKSLRYECIIVDEAHRARRRNLGLEREDEKADPNNLLKFLYEIVNRTKSVLLATATPVQLYPVEAWDLLHILSIGGENVLGNAWSKWRHASEAITVTMGKTELPKDELELWNWVRNPLPQSTEGHDFEVLRRSLNLPESQAVALGSDWEKLGPHDQSRVKRLARNFGRDHNPFIRHIVRRTREYLETTYDPETHEPYLQPVKVELFGERDEDAIQLPPYLRDAYQLAERFCHVLGMRLKGSGFLKTLLLRRMGSTIYAGKVTAENLLKEWVPTLEDEEEEDQESIPFMKTLTPEERAILVQYIEALEANQERDPKYFVVQNCLFDRHWLELGCIIFSQYYDSIQWLAEHLSPDIPDEPIGIYAGGQRSGVIKNGLFTKMSRDDLKKKVQSGEVRVLLGTDAASEGINLQRLGTLINLDLPWNPTRLEQRKGRIQRIGQLRDTVFIYNLRYKDSVEDRVHQLLSERLAHIYGLFGQIPDILEDVWIDMALGEIQKAKETIDAFPKEHPFEIKYHHIESVDWESCSKVLNDEERKRWLSKGW